jgi:imidazole glycerol-phosphate synthase subunit HisF
MSNLRLIPRLDIKGPNLIKGIHLEGLRVIGDPQEYATQYYNDGADELIYIDAVASLYQRNNLTDIVHHTAQNIFIPMTVGGGIRSIEDVKKMLRVGADKVAINTAAVKRPQILKEVAQRFGSQCMVLSIQAKKISDRKWEVYTDNGREKTGLDVLQWAKRGTELGAGEILLTSVDQEGTRKGFDYELVKEVSSAVSIPVIASGGMGSMEHLLEVVKSGQADAVAMADVLHYGRIKLREIRTVALNNKIHVRAF